MTAAGADMVESLMAYVLGIRVCRAVRHCERSEAIQGDVERADLDCFAALAMTMSLLYAPFFHRKNGLF
ncbi:hypothetical protein AE618_10165 [Bosea vaviloviae]|uniref:Uncharacterized protein n=1 Tax=Bosea vaviloviae TaxID=1526658 RepID=A0A0N1FIF2_9HYPH|nr:hypothetical protein AE618_10165 [Bosea vaviloviae]